MDKYKNPIILNIDVNGKKIKGTFTYKLVDKEKLIFSLTPLTKLLWDKNEISNFTFDKLNDNIKIRFFGKETNFFNYNYINGFNLKNLKIE